MLTIDEAHEILLLLAEVATSLNRIALIVASASMRKAAELRRE